MNQSPAQQWSALSALYEQADGLTADALAVWLFQLEAEQNPLLPQLKRMLAARAEVETNDFLGTLPKLHSPSPTAGANWAQGRQVGPYRLLRPLGEGGMAEVWLAERADGAIKRRVAIKLPFPRAGRETFAVRFDRERDILATLRHPNIAGLYDAGVTAEGQAWLALEYVDGEPLAAWCDQQRLSLRERVTLFRQVLLAVQHAHANLVIHRDLKPANILVTAQGEVRLLDFGIAKLLEAQGDAMPETELTRQGGSPLTPRYASPEQLTGMPLTTACDVYSLGVVFYELISGERPYEIKVESAAQLEHAILEIEPRAPSRRALTELHAADCAGLSVKALRKALAPELDAIVLRCLAKQPSARYASVDAVIADIDRWLNGEAVLARAPGAWYRFGKFAARNRLGVALGAGAVLSLIAVTAVAVVMGLQAREESARAVAARDFMLGIFKRADQEKSRGADITARDMLATGRKDVLTRLADQPSLQAELLEGIAKIQRDMGENTTADATFADLVKIYGGMSRPREAALALVARAGNAHDMGHTEAALKLLRDARTMPGRPTGDAELEARLSAVEAWIASIQGDPENARNLFRESEEWARKAYGPDDSRTLDVLRGRVQVERQMRNFDGALALQTELEARAARSKEADEKDLVKLAEDRMNLLYSAGRYAEALEHSRAMLPRCERALGPNHELCGGLLVGKLQASLRVGEVLLDPTEVRRVDAMARDGTSPFFATEALLLLSRIESVAGPSLRQQELLGSVRALGKSGADLAVDPLLKAKALLTAAEAELRLHAPGDAPALVTQALAFAPEEDRSLPAMLIRGVGRSLSGVALARSGHSDAALESMVLGQSDLARAIGPLHPLSRLFAMNIVETLHALGRDLEARALLVEADPILRRALGELSPVYLRIQGLKARLQKPANRVEPPAQDFFG
jgi:eukaryotic-like serine/threonine-protein kinase